MNKESLNKPESAKSLINAIRKTLRNVLCGSVVAASMLAGCSPTEGVSEAHQQELAKTQEVLNARYDNVDSEQTTQVNSNNTSEEFSQNSSTESNTEDFQDYQAKITNIADDGTVNVRPTPGTSVAALFVLPKGYEVTVINEHNEMVDGYSWLKVMLPNGKTGWIAKNFLEATE